jgi:hypothetical protein
MTGMMANATIGRTCLMTTFLMTVMACNIDTPILRENREVPAAMVDFLDGKAVAPRNRALSLIHCPLSIGEQG